MLRGWAAIIVAGLLGSAQSGVAALSFSLNGEAGLNIGQICTGGGSQCGADGSGSRVRFVLDPPPSPNAFFPAVGTIDVDTTNNLMDISLSVANSLFV